MTRHVAIHPEWAFVADTVMGGRSSGEMVRAHAGGRDWARLTGAVSLENNGGFIQMAADIDPALAPDRFEGVAFCAKGNGETYELRLKTTDLTRPWQSFRAAFVAPRAPEEITIAYADFEPYRTATRFDPARLRRIGILAVGRAFAADVSVADMRLVTL